MMKPERHVWEEGSTHRSVAGKEYDEVWDYAEQLEAENEKVVSYSNELEKRIGEHIKRVDKGNEAIRWLEAENKALTEFWNRLCEYIWDMGDFDGGTHQDWGVELGLLRIEIYDPDGKHKDWNVQDVIAGDEFFVNTLVKPPDALLTGEDEAKG